MITSVINEKSCSDSTKNRYLALIRAILNGCVQKWDMLDKSVYIELFKEPVHRFKWLRPKEAKTLLSFLQPYMADMAEFDLATGLKQGNVFNLRWRQIDFMKRVCEYYPEDMKASKPLVIPLNDTAMNVLLKQIGRHEEFVFVHSRNEPVKSLNYKWWKEALYKAKIEEGFHWHDLRHTWASWLVQSEVSLYALKELGGWQTLEMVQRYAHLAPEHLVKDAIKIDSIMTNDCHNLGTVNKPKEEVITVEMMRKMLKNMEECA